MEKIGDIAPEVLLDLRKFSICKYLYQLISKYEFIQVKSPDELKAFISEVDAITQIHKPDQP